MFIARSMRCNFSLATVRKQFANDKNVADILVKTLKTNP